MKLPCAAYEWYNPKIPKRDVTRFITNLDADGSHGYIIECDLTYPEELHEMHNDFPLAPEQVEVTYANLSKYAKTALKETGTFSTTYKSSKLMSTFFKRKNYIVHLKNLQLYIELGMKLTKIHRILRFEQSAFLKPYIDMCSEKRQLSPNKFEKDLWKKLANSVFGKTLQDPSKYKTVKLHLNEKSFQKAANSPTYKSTTILHEDMVLTSHDIAEPKFDKPFAVGFSILELSKWYMFYFYYNVLLERVPYQNVNLLMTDTDSFCLQIKNFSLSAIADYMDFSNYPKDHNLHDTSCQATPGFFKNELPIKKCEAFCGVRSKCYALKLEGEEKKVCKGLGRPAIQNRLQFSDYTSSLSEKKAIRHYFTTISSKKQQVRTVVQNKTAFSHFDSKRYIFDCGIHSRPYKPYGGSETICRKCNR